MAMKIKKVLPFKVPSIKKINSYPKSYKAVSFFAGCGGSSTGMKMAGFDVIYANEFVDIAADTYEANACKHTIVDRTDIRQIDFYELMDRLGLEQGELDHMDGSPPCHPAGNLVFTQRGYIDISEVVAGDMVLTHKNRWQKVTGTTSRIFKGPIVSIVTQNSRPTTCTPNHPFYTIKDGIKKWRTAQELDTDTYIKIPRDMGEAKLPEWSGVDIGVGYNRTVNEFSSYRNVSTLNDYFDNPDFWWVVGRFLGDGWVHERRKMSVSNSARRPSGLPVRSVIICCNPHNNECSNITTVLDRLGWKYKIKSRRTATRIGLHGLGEYGCKTELASFFKQFGDKAHGKFIPSFVNDLPCTLKKSVVDGYLSADGCIELTKFKATRAQFCSVSEQLFNGIVRLINDSYALCTSRHKIKQPKTWNIEGRSGMTRITYGTNLTLKGIRDSYTNFTDRNGDLWVRVRSLSATPSKCLVYNLHVEKDESFTVNFLASHNCSSFSTAGTREDGWGEEKAYSDGKFQRTDDLFFEFTKALRAFKPKTFDAENVSGLVKGHAKGYFLAIMRDLEDCGYVVKAQLLDASWLGVPQARQRIIFVGVRKDIAEDYDLAPVFPTPLKRQITVRECLPHVALIKTKVQGVIKYVDSNRPNSTITASDSLTSPTAKFSDGGYIETFEGEQRKYNIDELKVICGFPSDFKLLGKYEQQFERLGRSHVPVQMYWVCKAIKEEILDCLDDVEYKQTRSDSIFKKNYFKEIAKKKKELKQLEKDRSAKEAKAVKPKSTKSKAKK